MALSDYVERGGGTFCTLALLDGAITPGAVSLLIKNMALIAPDDRVAGMGVMIDDEIVKLVSWDDDAQTIEVQRGCADTVPVAHDDESRVWFFDPHVGSDGVKYAGSQHVAVKVRPVTSTSAPLNAQNVLPLPLVFGFRFGRPYPPGNLLVNGGQWWGLPKVISAIDPNLVLTWAHRDRILQADQLIPHTESSIGPEPGTTYELQVLTTGDSLLNQYVGITGDTHTYTLAQAASDFGLSEPDTAFGKLHLYSRRDGVLSRQFYTIPIFVNFTGAEGWGTSFGYGWGL